MVVVPVVLGFVSESSPKGGRRLRRVTSSGARSDPHHSRDLFKREVRPIAEVDYGALEMPAVMRSKRNRDATIEAMRQSGVEMLEIPAFLRKQAD